MNSSLITNLLDFLFPKSCFGCHRPGTYLCPNCAHSLAQKELICPTCSRLSIGGITHPLCRRQYGLDGLWSLGAYQGSLKIAIQKLKYRYVADLAEDLTALMIDYWVHFPPQILDQIRRNGAKNYSLVPVPLHWTRQNLRGFNQAALLAERLALKMGLCFENALIRTRSTKSQTKLEGSKRRHNIKNAFALAPNSQLPTPNIILVDDVWTTGSTLRECASVLKHAGAKTVWAITLAR